MAEAKPLPLSPEWDNAEEYTESLLAFTTNSDLFQRLCGGVHILDFFVQDPDLYTNLLPEDWRDWFQDHHISNVLDLLMREDLGAFGNLNLLDGCCKSFNRERSWRNGPIPPPSLLKYIQAIRSHALDRTFGKAAGEGDGMALLKVPTLSHHVCSGMKPKKIHEVERFAKYIDDLTSYIAITSPYYVTHIVDFGSGQNYLGRALASPPYNKHVVAIESKQLNIEGAMSMDVTAKLAKKEAVSRNKKQYRNGTAEERLQMRSSKANIRFSSPEALGLTSELKHHSSTEDCNLNVPRGEIQYIESKIQDGDLSNVIEKIETQSARLNDIAFTVQSSTSHPQLMVISLHSCGNLLHHGLRSIVLNPMVKAVATVGCCYNLVTERLGPPTYKLPSLRFQNLRLDRTSCVGDPHGFPMSERLASFKHDRGEGIRLNITARMMAVQAPQNWTDAESNAFFTRHFYRALLQRIFLDRGVLDKPQKATDSTDCGNGEERSGSGQPIIVGSLRKACYTSFTAYVHGAVAKLSTDKDHGIKIKTCMTHLTEEDIRRYEENYRERKKELSIVWSLMAFSAVVVESIIVVDRWLYLREQKEVKDCWVDAVFEYKNSPRNLVVVGIKR